MQPLKVGEKSKVLGLKEYEGFKKQDEVDRLDQEPRDYASIINYSAKTNPARKGQGVNT